MDFLGNWLRISKIPILKNRFYLDNANIIYICLGDAVTVLLQLLTMKITNKLPLIFTGLEIMKYLWSDNIMSGY